MKQMILTKNIIGIDIGSNSISTAELSPQKAIGKTFYSRHNGDIKGTLIKYLESLDLAAINGIAVTSSSPAIFKTAHIFDSRISYISAAKHLHGRIGSILTVGAEKFGVILFDTNGEYLNYKSNSSCASGTGSFLDQQAKRLNLKDIEEFAEISFNNMSEIPKIASRCAVFAKTDLIHAQQEGYTLESICDGLSYGLAKNIVDKLFNNSLPNSPLIFTGGVSKNKAVVKHISDMLGLDIIVDEYSNLYGSIGAALSLIDERKAGKTVSEFSNPANVHDIIAITEKEKTCYYLPLDVRLSQYPDFKSNEKYEYKSGFDLIPPVEVDVYAKINKNTTYRVYAGIDIGSTSTKAVLLAENKEIIAGFYTRTSGRPVESVQAIFESIDNFKRNKNINLLFLAAGTTGSGRKFIKEITGADIALDEITAHARAAYELDKDVDTIIEIGGQDSKFTTLKNGMVTFSIMNNVCAAGTGSFIEEQAKKLDCPLDEYSAKAEGSPAPLSSDKCTVFMERDLNFYLNDGYSKSEVLASVLHSVRENYLTKVAIQSSIGNKIFFQGATAKNKALVAAFEQKLGKPVMVSEYCHLTGAIGAALYLSDNRISGSSFKGIDIYRNHIPVRSEICELCTNHCKIKIAEVNNDTVAFGFLCGRDYDTKKYISKNPSKFDLLKIRKQVFNFSTESKVKGNVSIGLPAGLHVFDELPLWEKFFDLLSIKTVTSENYRECIKEGNKIRGAEFCAPVTAMHGHIKYLADKSDYIFLPFYLEEKQNDERGRRLYCYYTQYTPSLITSLNEINVNNKILSPVKSANGTFHLKVQLYKMLNSIVSKKISFIKISSAYDQALEYFNSCKDRLKEVFINAIDDSDINIVLLGRPYTILSESMNNGIPDIFAKHGIKTFFQDMLDYNQSDLDILEPLLKKLNWHYAAKIIESAAIIADTPGVYPVLVTSFKCAPDSFVIGCFKELLDSYGKPYLILQLDEHSSNVGYETRVEASIRAFRNHFNAGEKKISINIKNINPSFISGLNSLRNKAMLMPNFDNLSCKLAEAVLRKEGIDARLLEEKEESIKRSLIFNSGQCLPVNVIAEACIEYIEKNNLDPANTVLWSLNSAISCNAGMLPYLIKKVLESYGKDMDKVSIFAGGITYMDLSIKIAINAYFAYMFGGLLRKLCCKIRPYEKIKGSTDNAIETSMKILYNAFLQDLSKEEALDKVISLFEAIKTIKEDRPKVAIIGDIYARDNAVFNQNLIKTIEDSGGEVISTPYNEYMKIIADPYIQKWFREGLYAEAATSKVLKTAIPIFEKKYYKYFKRILNEPDYNYRTSPKQILSKFNITMFHTGESLETILKIFNLLNRYPEITLFVQTSPALCCPSLITEAMAGRIEKITGVPVVSLEYDGTGGLKNEAVIPYLKYPRRTHFKARKKA